MKITAMFLMSGLVLNIVAADDQPQQLALLNRKAQGQKTVLRGIVARSATGHLECRVTHDGANNSYSGELENNRYQDAEWFSQGLSAEKAQDYFQQLVAVGGQVPANADAPKAQ